MNVFLIESVRCRDVPKLDSISGAANVCKVRSAILDSTILIYLRRMTALAKPAVFRRTRKTLLPNDWWQPSTAILRN